MDSRSVPRESASVLGVVRSLQVFIAILAVIAMLSLLLASLVWLPPQLMSISTLMAEWITTAELMLGVSEPGVSIVANVTQWAYGLTLLCWALGSMFLYWSCWPRVLHQLGLLRSQNSALSQRESIHAPVALLQIDLSGKLLAYNFQAAQLLDFKDDAEHLSLLHAVYENDRDFIESALHKFHSGEQQQSVLEFRLLSEKGRLTWVLVQCKVSATAKGQVNSLQMALMDIHKLKQSCQTAERAATQAKITLSERLQLLRHRSDKLLSCVSEAQRQLKIDSGAVGLGLEQSLQLIGLEGLVVAVMAQKSVGSLRFELESLGLDDALVRLGDYYQRMAQKRGLQWHLNYSKSQFSQKNQNRRYRGDSASILGIVHLFLGLALEVSTEGELSVRILLECQDESTQKKDRLQVNIVIPVNFPLNHQEQSPGIMAAVHCWVKDLGGRLQIDYQKGKGCLVDLDLALVRADADDLLLREHHRTLPAHILIVEDTPMNQMITKDLLQQQGYQVSQARNGHEALQRLQAKLDVDLVLLDLQMPVMDGISCVKEIRKLPALAKLPVLALTVDTDPATRDLCLQAGMDDVLIKPIHPKRLGEQLRHYLRSGEDSHLESALVQEKP